MCSMRNHRAAASRERLTQSGEGGVPSAVRHGLFVPVGGAESGCGRAQLWPSRS